MVELQDAVSNVFVAVFKVFNLSYEVLNERCIYRWVVMHAFNSWEGIKPLQKLFKILFGFFCIDQCLHRFDIIRFYFTYVYQQFLDILAVIFNLLRICFCVLLCVLISQILVLTIICEVFFKLEPYFIHGVLRLLQLSRGLTKHVHIWSIVLQFMLQKFKVFWTRFWIFMLSCQLHGWFVISECFINLWKFDVIFIEFQPLVCWELLDTLGVSLRLYLAILNLFFVLLQQFSHAIDSITVILALFLLFSYHMLQILDWPWFWSHLLLKVSILTFYLVFEILLFVQTLGFKSGVFLFKSFQFIS